MDAIKNVKQAYARLLDQFNKINSNEAWINYLKFQSRFYRYSFNNAMLIMAQRPHATFVAGYVRWRQLGWQVQSGEQAIKIFAPIVYKQVDIKNHTEEAIVTGVHVKLDGGISVKGMYNRVTHLITINAEYSWTQKIKTLIHEYAHHLVNAEAIQMNRQMEEMVVESVSFIVSDYLGFDTSN